MDKNLQDIYRNRRSFYELGKDSVLPDGEIADLIRHAVKYAPTAFNSQSGRVLLLLGKEHERLWDLTTDILRGIVPPDKFQTTEEKLGSFKAGYGTVLFFEEQDTVAGLQKDFPLYRDNFPVWSLESSGMLQYMVWTLLEEAGFGASLQHYNPLIDEKVQSTWGIPGSWKLLAQMPFGKPTGEPDEKDFLPLEERVRVSH